MKYSFTNRQLELLGALFTHENSVHASLGEKAITGTLSSNEIDILCEIISNEMLMNGVEKNFEANAYGKELEALLDVVNRPRLRG